MTFKSLRINTTRPLQSTAVKSCPDHLYGTFMYWKAYNRINGIPLDKIMFYFSDKLSYVQLSKILASKDNLTGR